LSLALARGSGDSSDRSARGCGTAAPSDTTALKSKTADGVFIAVGEQVKVRILRDQAMEQPTGAKEASPECDKSLGRTLYRVHFTCALTWTVLDAGDITLEITR
jgi:hypothetical protein